MRDDVVAQADIAGHALHAPVTGEAAVRVVRVDERQHILPRLFDLRRVRTHDHLVAHRRGAGQLQAAARALDLDETSPATRVGRQAIDVAEVGYVDAVVFNDLHERGPVWRLDPAAVDDELRQRASL